jgi:predicted carbohydrate-binding protein with CBM5 and CBM33 domain
MTMDTMTTTTPAPAAAPIVKPKVGDILYSSWGYEQTNVFFYQVIEVKPSGKSIVVRQLEPYATYDAQRMTGTKVAIKDAFIGPALLKRVKQFAAENYGIKIESFAWAWPWDGKPKSYSSYA